MNAQGPGSGRYSLAEQSGLAATAGETAGSLTLAGPISIWPIRVTRLFSQSCVACKTGRRRDLLAGVDTKKRAAFSNRICKRKVNHHLESNTTSGMVGSYIGGVMMKEEINTNDSSGDYSTKREPDLKKTRAMASHPLLIALVSGVCGIIGTIITVYFNRPEVPNPTTSLVSAESALARLKAENEELKAENSKLRAANSIRPTTENIVQRSSTVESFVIPSRKFAGVANRSYIITVVDIQGGVAELRLKQVTADNSIDEVIFVTKANTIQLNSEKYECRLHVIDVMGFAVNLETECRQARLN